MTERRRILFLDHAGVLGGGELSLLSIARAFRDEAEVILFEDGPFRRKLAEDGVAVSVLPMSGKLRTISRNGGLLNDAGAIPALLGHCFKVARLARSSSVIYANSQKSMIVGAIAGALSRRPVIWHLRDLMDVAHFSSGHIRLAVGVANAFVSRIIANSEATRDAFIASGGKAAKTLTVYNGIESDPFDSVDPSTSSLLRTELGVTESDLLVGCFSRLSDWKGQHVLLEAIRKHPGWHALLVGDAIFDADTPYKSMLETLASRYGMADRVHFLGFRDNVPELMAACDIVAHTSTAPEPFGRVIVEGMLSRKPVIATNAGGAVELIRDRQTGLLVPPNDAIALQGAISSLEQDAQLRATIASQGHDEAVSRFSSDRLVREVRAIVDSTRGGT